MNCREIQSLAGPYLDSELDTTTSYAIQQHLAACPDCARRLAAEQEFVTRLATALRRGEATPRLWTRTEDLVRAAAAARKDQTPAGREQPADRSWRAWLWPSPQFYAGVLALWILMLAVHFGYVREPVEIQVADRPPSPTVRSALAEQRRELAELLGTAGASRAASAPRPKPVSPRSELRQIHDQPDRTSWLVAMPDLLPA